MHWQRQISDLKSIANEKWINPRVQDPQVSPRGLRSENTLLRADNQRLELEVSDLTNKLAALESSIQGMVSSEKIKVSSEGILHYM